MCIYVYRLYVYVYMSMYVYMSVYVSLYLRYTVYIFPVVSRLFIRIPAVSLSSFVFLFL